MLLFWSSDVAKGRNIAAIRFDTLVKVDSIRLIPNGALAFENVPTEIGFVF